MGKGLESHGESTEDAPSTEQRLSSPIPVGKRLTYCPWCRGGRRAQISLGLVASWKEVDCKASQAVTSPNACLKQG